MTFIDTINRAGGGPSVRPGSISLIPDAESRVFTMRGMSGLSWLLPVSSIGFFAFAGTAIYGAIALDWAIWLLAAIALPAIPFVWLGLMLALMDVTRRPDDHLSDEARMIWTGVICILNVFAFIPYWLIVVRNNPPIPAPAPSSNKTTDATQ